MNTCEQLNAREHPHTNDRPRADEHRHDREYPHVGVHPRADERAHVAERAHDHERLNAHKQSNARLRANEGADAFGHPHEHDHAHSHDHPHSHAHPRRPDPVPELLAPAGGPAAFDAALAGGADAIFVGYGQELNARRSAESLVGDVFSAYVRKAHLAGARVYVTMNIVVKGDELPHALALVREAWVRGADAFIVQDLGLLREIRLRWPEIELHASTQMNVHDARGAAWCREQGMKRVTLSRELSVGEIATIAKTGVELEGFGHGALCFCYSGICQMSSTTGARSANRGACAQPCRLLYALVDESGKVLSHPGWDRPLCPRDLRSTEHLRELRDAGLASLKVEGRLKAPDYVLSVVSAYRESLDALARGQELSPERHADIEDRLRRSFNRDFTDAYLRGRSGNEMMSYERSNNRGELVGEVVASRDLGSVMVRRGGSEGGRERFRRMTRAEVTVELTRPVGAGDLLEVRPVDDPSQFLTGLAEEDAAAGERIVVKTARPMPAGCPVRVIRSQRALDAAAQVNADVPRKRAVAVNVLATLGRPLTVELSALDLRAGLPAGPVRAQAEAKGPLVETARTKELSFEELEEHVCRMGATPFEPVGFAGMKDPGIGMAFSAVHRTRADACAALEGALLAPWAGRNERAASAPDAADLSAELSSAISAEAVAPDPRNESQASTSAQSESEASTSEQNASQTSASDPKCPQADAQHAVCGTVDARRAVYACDVSQTSTSVQSESQASTSEQNASQTSASGPKCPQVDAQHAVCGTVSAQHSFSGADNVQGEAPDSLVPSWATLGDSLSSNTSPFDEVEICVLAPTPEVAEAAHHAGAVRVYATADSLAHSGEVGPHGEGGATSWDDTTVPWLDEVCREGDHARLDPWVRPGCPVAVGNLSELVLADERGALAEVRSTVPAHNASTLLALRHSGARGAWLSGELSLNEACELAKAGRDMGLAMGIAVYGRARVMTSEHCVLQVADRCCGDCASCRLRLRKLSLCDKEGRLWPVRTDLQGRSRIYAPWPLDATPQVGELIASGVTRLLVDATLLGPEEAAAAVRRVREAIEAVRAGRRPAPRKPDASSGHLFAPIS